MAPPMIAVQRIPAKAPCECASEFSARDMMIGHITEAKKPMRGKSKQGQRLTAEESAVRRPARRKMRR